MLYGSDGNPPGSGLITATVMAVGYVSGSWLVILAAALAGAQYAVSRSETLSVRQYIGVLLRSVSSSLALTGGGMYALQQYTKLPASFELMAVVAFAIAAGAERVISPSIEWFASRFRLPASVASKSAGDAENSKG